MERKDFEEIYQKYGKQVYAVCFHNTHDRELSKDMVQDIFFSLWKRDTEAEDYENIENYLVRAAKLKVMEHYRTEMLHRQKIQQLNIVPGHECAPENHIYYKDCYHQLFRIIELLPAKTKQIFLLSRSEGLSHKAIAQNYNLSEKAVEYHIRRALNLLRRHR